jgi:glycosyltransferase involved in cell wall biosynthesis
LPAIAAILFGKTRVKVIHLLYDLYPDILILAGKTRRGSTIAQLLEIFTRTALRYSTATVFIGQRLRVSAENDYGPARQGVIIEVGGDGRLFSEEPKIKKDSIRVLYAGNFGHAHDYETIAQVLSKPLPIGIEFVFHASGFGYKALKQRLAGKPSKNRIVFDGPLNSDAWVSTMAHADIGLVTLLPGAEDILFPSKTYSAMLAGQAILAICPIESDLADTVIQSGGGWVVKPNDEAHLRALLLQLAADPERVLAARKAAQSYARTHYEMSIIATKWSALFNSLRTQASSKN